MGRRAKTSAEKIRNGAGAASSSLSGESVCTHQGAKDGMAGCVGGLEARRVKAPSGFADLGSADGEFQGAEHSARQGTHRTAGPSPRCALEWVLKKIKDIEVSILEEYKEEPLTRDSIIFHNASLSKHEVGRFIGKKGRCLRKIECFCGVFFTLSDYETEVEILMWGPLRACALAQFVVEAFENGFYSIVDSLSYLDL